MQNAKLVKTIRKEEHSFIKFLMGISGVKLVKTPGVRGVYELWDGGFLKLILWREGKEVKCAIYNRNTKH